jgi:hypothetical protein
MMKSSTSKPPAAPRDKPHPLVGRGLHYKDERGCVHNQATILAIVPSNSPEAGDLALIQYFDWLMGEPSTQRLLPLTELASSERWVFYENVEQMKDHYQRVDAHRDEHIRQTSNGSTEAAPH